MYKKIHFYYCALSAILFSIWFVFFAPKPDGLILLVFFIPIPIFFWQNIFRAYSSNNEKAGQVNKIEGVRRNKFTGPFFLTLFATLMISIIAIVFYTQFKNDSNNTEELALDSDKVDELTLKINQTSERLVSLESDTKYILKQINLLTEDLQDEKSGSEVSVLGLPEGADEESFQDKLIQITGIKAVDVYENSSFSSKKIGIVENNNIYPYVKKLGEWYLITLPDSTEGWISAQYTKNL